MEKMLKSNNSLTAFNTLLLLGCLWISYQNYQSNAKNTLAIHDIKAALFYARGIKLPPADDNSRNESGRHVALADVILSESKTGTSHKRENN